MAAPCLGRAGSAWILLSLTLAPSCAVRLGVQPAHAAVGQSKHNVTKKKPFTGSLYFMHLPKAAGDSFMADAPKYCGRRIGGSETNYCKSRNGANGTLDRQVVAMVRDPRAHVLSMYFHCKTGHEYVMQGWHERMPDRIIDWLRPWAKAEAYDDPETLHRFCCYSPVNLQSRRFSCSQGLDEAKRHVEKAYFVGLVEHYHVSLCLLGARVNGSLRKGCNCADARDKDDEDGESGESHLNHGVQLHSAAHLPAQHLELIDNMTREDSIIYELARKRFWADVERVEKNFKVRVVCNDERRFLRAPRAMSLTHARAQARPSRVPARLPTRPRAPGGVAISAEDAPLARPQAPDADDAADDASAAESSTRLYSVGSQVRARARARPAVAATDFLQRVPARARMGQSEGLSFLELDSGGSSASLAAESNNGRGTGSKLPGCPNEGYLLHGTGAGR